MRLRSVALGLLVCLPLAFVVAAQEPPAGKVDVVLETDTDLDYTSRLRNRIIQHAHAAAVAITDSGEVRVRFRIRRDGEAHKPIISLSSSKPVLDDTALKAVTDALAHVEPLPAEITRSFVDFQARFLFNQAPPQKTEGVSLADLARQRSKRSTDGEKKVFTNEEVATTPDPEPSSGRNRTSSKSTSTSTKAKSSTSSASDKTSSDEKPPELDPQHYRDRLQVLREQLSQVNGEITNLRYSSPQTTAGMATISNTQKNELERLERKKTDIEKRIAAVCEEARRNDITVAACIF
jgi:hypothetical protein